jgi:hypothetical protein
MKTTQWVQTMRKSAVGKFVTACPGTPDPSRSPNGESNVLR